MGLNRSEHKVVTVSCGVGVARGKSKPERPSTGAISTALPDGSGAVGLPGARS